MNSSFRIDSVFGNRIFQMALRKPLKIILTSSIFIDDILATRFKEGSIDKTGTIQLGRTNFLAAIRRFARAGRRRTAARIT